MYTHKLRNKNGDGTIDSFSLGPDDMGPFDKPDDELKTLIQSYSSFTLTFNL